MIGGIHVGMENIINFDFGINNIQITPNRRLGKGDKYEWTHI